jgi:hypothetical protein
MADNLKNMSAEKLYELAKQRELEEQQKAKQEKQQKIADLREQRRQLQLRHKKEINEINAKIKALGGRVTGAATSGKGRTGASAAIIKILDAGEMNTNEIREKLEAHGISVGNLGQTLAYLKRSGRIVSVSRGVYKNID